MSRELEAAKRYVFKNHNSPRVKAFMESKQQVWEARNEVNLNGPMFPSFLKPLEEVMGPASLRNTVDMLYRQQFVLDNAKVVEESLRTLTKERPYGVAVVKGLLWKQRGGELFRKGEWAEARQAYFKSIRDLLAQGDDYELPRPTVPHRDLQDDAITESIFAYATMAANNIAQCYVKEGNRVAALDWLEEVHRMYLSITETKIRPSYAWKDLYLGYEEYLTVRIKVYMRQSHIYEELGNTSAALASLSMAGAYGEHMMPGPEREENPTIAKLRASDGRRDRLDFLGRMRHPDPETVENLKVVEPELQVRGAWKMIKTKGSGPLSRRELASAVWKGMFYVFGGEHALGKLHDDGWAINLRDPERGWRKVTAPPGTADQMVYAQTLVVWGDKGYIFQGVPNVLVFDFRKEIWSKLPTKLKAGAKWR